MKKEQIFDAVTWLLLAFAGFYLGVVTILTGVAPLYFVGGLFIGMGALSVVRFVETIKGSKNDKR